MRIGSNGEALIKSYEKLRLVAYRDSKGVLTIGWGHTGAAGELQVTPGLRITEEEADRQFAEDIRKFENIVSRSVKVQLSQNQFDALVSFEFNTGELIKSTLLKKLNAGRMREIPSEFMKWTHSGGQELSGLEARRRAEVRLWLKHDEAQELSEEELDHSGSTPDSPRSKGMVRSKIGNSSLLIGAGAAMETVSQVHDTVQQVSDTTQAAQDVTNALPLDRFMNAVLSHPSVFVMLAIAIGAGAIWYWRREHMQEEGA